MPCCCMISDDPIEVSTGRRKTFNGQFKFQVSMMDTIWCPDGISSFGWFCGQFFPFTCGITQFLLRRKILNNDMTKYSCFQGYFDTCCIKAGSCCESEYPNCCLFLESCCCNSCAISVSRMYVMEKYDLQSDPCDYRLVRINNCIQCLACICDILSIFDEEFKQYSSIIDNLADLLYHCVSGCMTAQVAYEVDYQNRIPQIAHPVDYRTGFEGNDSAPLRGKYQS